jgi:hypothetical protein
MLKIEGSYFNSVAKLKNFSKKGEKYCGGSQEKGFWCEEGVKNPPWVTFCQQLPVSVVDCICPKLALKLPSKQSCKGYRFYDQQCYWLIAVTQGKMNGVVV